MTEFFASRRALRVLLAGDTDAHAGLFIGGEDVPPRMLASTHGALDIAFDEFVCENWPGEADLDFSVKIQSLPGDKEFLVVWRT